MGKAISQVPKRNDINSTGTSENRSAGTHSAALFTMKSRALDPGLQFSLSVKQKRIPTNLAGFG